MLKRKHWMAGLFGSRFLLLVVPGTTEVPSKSVGAFEKNSISSPSFFAVFGADTLIDKGSTTDSLRVSVNAAALSENSLLPPPAAPINRTMAGYIKKFRQTESESLNKVKERSAFYFKTIERIFDQYDLPAGLKYLAVVESELKVKAVSHVGAKGIWQLMPVTARDLGLKVTNRYDERMHFYKSTVAAAKYLKDLYEAFDDWLLVVAAYNGGPGPIYRAIKKSGSRSFWRLQYYLPTETRVHVKRYIATHYFFEGAGSLTTLTKAEGLNYAKKLEQYYEQQCREEEKPLVAGKTINSRYVPLAKESLETERIAEPPLTDKK